MNKLNVYLIALVLLFSCEQKSSNSSAIKASEKEPTATIRDSQVNSNKVARWLNPAYLSADFNSDGYTDTAFAVIINNKRGIRIKHGNTNEVYLLGVGNHFGNGGDDFEWADHWHLVTDSITYEVTFMEEGDIDGSRDVLLHHPAFYIGKEEVGGATIAWLDEKYTWIHQAD